MNSIERPASEFASILKTLGYRRRKVWIRVTEHVTLLDLNWSGGTRMEYTSFAIDSRSELGNTSRFSRMAPWNNYVEGKSIAIPPGAIVVSHGHFCGKDAMATIHVNPADMPKLLTQI